MNYKILSINPGSTSTKIALYENETELFCTTLRHSVEELAPFPDIADQYDFRKNLVMTELEKHGYKAEDLSAVVGRGGLFTGIKAGGYKVTEKMKEMAASDKVVPHASNIGSLISAAIAEPLGIPAYIYDSVCADELTDEARVTGLSDIVRTSTYHVLNTKAMGRKYAESVGKKYEDLNMIIAHMGGGITVGAHCKGRIVDVLADHEGPFSPERAGGLPALDLVKLCFSGKYDEKTLGKMIRGNGGLKSLLGTTDCIAVENEALAGNEKTKLIYDAMAYNVAKGIAKMAPALKFNIDAVVITGGIAYSKYLTDLICEYLGGFANVVVLPGENEMEALTFGALRILKGEEIAQEY